MTEANGMIVRTWSATATGAGAGDYSRYFAGTLLPELRRLAGFAGAYLLRRDSGGDGTVELTACTKLPRASVIISSTCRGFSGSGPSNPPR